jgi:hypothetical protein
MTKPIEIGVLEAKMHRWLGEAEAAADGGAGTAPEHLATSAFDAGVVQRRFLGDGGLFSEVRDLFVEQTRLLLQGLSEQTDPVAVRKVMHRIRGSASTLGADRLAAVCLQLEEAGDAQPAPAGALAQARSAFEAFVKASAGATATG